MKIISSVFEYPGYKEAWDEYLQANDKLTKRLKKAGISISLLTKLTISIFRLFHLENKYRRYCRLMGVLTREEWIAKTLQQEKRAQGQEGF